MLPVGLDPLFAEAEKTGGVDPSDRFLLRLAARGVSDGFHMIDLAADDAPMAGFRRFQTLAKQKLAVV